jgi:Peptidase family M48
VAVTRGILEICDDQEIEGVLAHELGHVRNRDILISAVVATVAGAITLLARMAYWGELFTGFGGRDNDREGGGGIISAIAMIILAPLAATLIQLAISRSRPHGRRDHRQSHGSGARPRQDRQVLQADSVAGLAGHGSHLLRSAVDHRGRFFESFFHSPTHTQAHRTANRPGFRLT